MLPKVVLVADNDVRAREAIQLSLAPLGPLILTARTGERALALAQEVRPAVVLLDVDVAGMTASDVAVHLRAHPATATVPIILLAPPAIVDDLVDTIGPGGIICIPKPFEPATLVASIKVYLDISC